MSALPDKQVQSMDSSPKWFTEVELDLTDGWMESTIEYLPGIVLDETPFTRVEFHNPRVDIIPLSTLSTVIPSSTPVA